MALSAGTRLGPYEIVSAVGAGGMGEVYKARDTRLGRDVAIKVLPAHLSQSPDFKQRFEREAKSISGLQHPHICVLHDIGHESGTDFLVLEFLEGETLAERLKRGALPFAELRKLAIEIAEALDKAHRHNIVHRDLKPGNVMLTRSGAKLMDFGLAKPAAIGAGAGAGSMPAFTAAGTVSAPSPASPLTGAGTVVGTFQYMSPEQIQGQEADARSDIFSFGAVLYEMATGKRAFDGKSQLGVASAILEKEPEPIRTIVPQAPPPLERIVGACLAKDPQERFASAHDLVLELKWIEEAPAVEKATIGVKKPIAWAGWIAALVLAMLAAMAWVSRPQTQTTTRARFSIAMPTGGWLRITEGRVVALSPDGRTVAYIVRPHEAGSALYVRRVDEFEPRVLVGPTRSFLHSPFFSPDGRWVGYFSSSKLQKIPVDGGPTIDLCDIVDPAGATWAPDGNIYLTRHWTEGISRVPDSGGKVETVTKPDPSRKEQSHRWPRMLPNGEALLFTIMTSVNADDAEIGVLSLKTGKWKSLMQQGYDAHFVPPGYLVYLRAGSLMSVPFDLKSLSTLGTPTPIMSDILADPEGAVAQFDVSANGTLAYVPGGNGVGAVPETSVVWVGEDGKETVASRTPKLYEDMSLSPNGQTVAMTITAQQWNIWTLDLARGTLSRLTFTGDNRDPLFARDNNHVVYTSFRNGRFGLYWSTMDGSEPERRLVESDFEPFAMAFTPDGKSLIYNARSPDAGFKNWMVPVDGSGQPAPIAQGPANKWFCDISPDGRWLVYESDESGRPEIYLQAVSGTGGKWQLSTDGGIRPQWDRHGTRVFYRAGDTMMAVDVATSPSVRAATPKTLFTGPYIHAGRDYGYDGKRFIFLKANGEKLGPTELRIAIDWSATLKK